MSFKLYKMEEEASNAYHIRKRANLLCVLRHLFTLILNLTTFFVFSTYFQLGEFFTKWPKPRKLTFKYIVRQCVLLYISLSNMFAGFGATRPSPSPLTRKRPAVCRSGAFEGAFEGLGHFRHLLALVDKDERRVLASLV